MINIKGFNRLISLLGVRWSDVGMRWIGSDFNGDHARRKALFKRGKVLLIYLRSTDLKKKLSGGEYGTRIERKNRC